MKTTLTLVPGTDAFYNVRVQLLAFKNPVFLGQVRKVYLTRTTVGWTLAPRDYPEDRKMRLVYKTRGKAVEALLEFVKGECKRTSLVEG